MLGRLISPKVTNFAARGNPHEMEPGANQEALVEGQPNKRAHLPWADVVPDFLYHLNGCGVLEVESLNEGENIRGVSCSPSVLVAPFGSVAEEGSVTKRVQSLPIPLPKVPRKVLDEFCFKDPIERGFLTRGRRLSGHFEGGPGSFLGKDSNRVVVVDGDDEGLVACGLDAAASRGLLEFNNRSLAWGGFKNVVHPIEWGARAWG